MLYQRLKTFYLLSVNEISRCNTADCDVNTASLTRDILFKKRPSKVTFCFSDGSDSDIVKFGGVCGATGGGVAAGASRIRCRCHMCRRPQTRPALFCKSAGPANDK